MKNLPPLLYILTVPNNLPAGRTGQLVFVDDKSTNRSGQPLLVPIKIVDGTSARVSTVFFAEANTAAVVIYNKEGQ